MSLYKIEYIINNTKDRNPSNDAKYSKTLENGNFGEFFFSNKHNNMKIITIYKYDTLLNNTSEYLLFSDSMRLVDINENLKKYEMNYNNRNNWDTYIAYASYSNNCYYNYSGVEEEGEECDPE